jgi:HAMP domain-containing protein
MNQGLAIRAVGLSNPGKPSAIDYTLRLKASANDALLEVRDTAAGSDWKRAHHELVRLAKERAGLDWEEGRSLLVALRARAHHKLGCGTFEEYIERLFGYSPRFTNEKLRVAEALEVLTEMAQALKDGQVSWSSLREITRVATPRTEAEWLQAARGRTVRQIERLVSGKKPGDGPNDLADEAHRRHVIRLEVSGASYATFREMMGKLRRDSGEPLDDDAAVMMMARHVLGGPKDTGRSSYQIKLDMCENCRRGRQQARGQMVEVAPEVVEMAE